MAEDYPKITNPAMRQFYERGLTFIQATGKGFPVKQGTEEWNRWAEYFRALGCEPYQMKMVRWKQLETMTMPAQWPEWFDTDWARRQAA